MNKDSIYLLIIIYVLSFITGIFYRSFSERYVNYEEYKLYNGDYWEEYRIGDLYKFGGFIACGRKNPGCKDKRYHVKYFPLSIAYCYHTYNPTNIKTNEEAMKKAIIRVRNNNNITIYDNVLHLRVGDIMLGKDYSKNKYSKIHDKKWWDDYIKWSKDNNCESVLIIAGSHNIKKREKWKPSFEFIDKIKTLLEDNGINVDLRIGQSPDIDIITAFSAKYFASTGGTYGKLMKQLASTNNVNVFKSES
jgi:hypothetical protein